MPLSHRDRPLYELKAGLFKGLAHPLRIRILELLADGQEHTVGELQEQIAIEPSHLSQHLAVIRRYHLVVSERRRSNVYYRIAYPEVAQFLALARALLTRILEDASESRELADALPAVGR
jgi:Predicted transcriptional regulators